MPEYRNQTVTFLTQKFREIGIQPVSKHGQNFLIDMNILNLIVRSADLSRKDVVLEVGTGTGTLSTRMADQAGHVVTVEIDEHLHQLSMEELIDFENVTMLQFDVLKNKNNFAPKVLETVKEQLALIPDSNFKLVSNLPYNIATPIISNLLRTDILPKSMTVTIQKELGERIVARPRTKDYSALSIWMQSQCDCEIVRILPPTVFWPRPKVESAIIHLVLNPKKRARIVDIEFFHKFVRALFFHRRKFLRNVLQSAMKGILEKKEVDAILQKHKYRKDARAEEFEVEQIIELAEIFRQAVPEPEE
ncbi:MAG: ribosomal RNA small subunit methyltransferase A [Blastopirellula sp.]|nr:MAG: ribosomal RNA small subunit methyltransferase A [Blastopirellula sp.]